MSAETLAEPVRLRAKARQAEGGIFRKTFYCRDAREILNLAK
jgi:hypothetical protein